MFTTNRRVTTKTTKPHQQNASIKWKRQTEKRCSDSCGSYLMQQIETQSLLEHAFHGVTIAILKHKLSRNALTETSAS